MPGGFQGHTIGDCSLCPRVGKARESSKHWLPLTQQNMETEIPESSVREILEGVGRWREASARRQRWKNDGVTLGVPRMQVPQAELTSRQKSSRPVRPGGTTKLGPNRKENKTKQISATLPAACHSIANYGCNLTEKPECLGDYQCP